MEAVLLAAVSLITGLAGLWFGRRQRAAEAATNEAQAQARKAEAESIEASSTRRAIEAVQSTYQELLADQAAQVAAAHSRASAAEAAARDAREQARQSSDAAWSASQAARQMQWFLTELRPLIAAHVPNAEPILERLDRLATPPAVRA